MWKYAIFGLLGVSSKSLKKMSQIWIFWGLPFSNAAVTLSSWPEFNTSPFFLPNSSLSSICQGWGRLWLALATCRDLCFFLFQRFLLVLLSDHHPYYKYLDTDPYVYEYSLALL